MTELTDVPTTGDAVRGWLVEQVAHYTERSARDIDPDVSVAEYGLDSVYTFALCGDIEEMFGLDVEPTVVWDFDTLTALTAHLVGLLAAKSDR